MGGKILKLEERYFELHLTGIVEFLEVGKVEKWPEAMGSYSGVEARDWYVQSQAL